MLALVIALGAALRFATLGQQHFWLDEAVTAGLLELDLFEMFEAMWTTESTPPLYYFVARGWAGVFGTGEVGLRSLSALLGTLTIPVVYATGATLASRRVGLVAAVLAALSPALVWYSQEARSYSLAILLCAVSLLFAARVRRGGARRGDFIGWAAASALALATHYFAVFLVAGQAIWLLLAGRDRRAVALATAAVGAFGALLVPLAVHQSNQGNLEFIGATPLPTRIVDTAQLFVAGPTGDRIDLGVGLLYASAAAAMALGLTAARPARRTALELAALALGGIAAAIVMDLAGADYVLPRNLLPLWAPLVLVAAVGIACARSAVAGLAVGVTLAATSTWLTLAVPLDATLQREEITRSLLALPLDVEERRVDPHVRYAVADEGERVSVRAECEEGTGPEASGAVLRHGADEAPVGPRVSGSGASITATAREDGSVASVYVVCVGARD